MFGIRLMIMLLVMGGFTAFIGDRIGKTIGKKRLSLFGMRPRNTARFITIASGCLIVGITLIILLSLFDDTRTALFGIEQLKNTIQEKRIALRNAEKNLIAKTKALAHLEKKLTTTSKKLTTSLDNVSHLAAEKQKRLKEVQLLKKVVDLLGEDIERTREENITFSVNDVLLSRTQAKVPSKPAALLALQETLSLTDALVRPRALTTSKPILFMPTPVFNNAAKELSAKKTDSIIQVVVTSNVVKGEQIPVRFNILSNPLIFQANEPIASVWINGKKELSEIEQDLKMLLQEANQVAKAKGMIVRPDGSVGQVSYASIFSTAKQIKQEAALMQATIVSQKETYAAGPLHITFQVKR